MKPCICLERVSKQYGRRKAVCEISFSVMEGQISAFLGPNGAGKSTTMKMLATLLKPTSGKILVEGYSMESQREQIKRCIGVVFQEDVLDNELTVYQNLYYRGSLYYENRQQTLMQLNDVVESLSLKDILHKRYGTCYGGQKRICQIGRTLMSKPKLLLLDEPTTGLDPIARQAVWDVLVKLNQESRMTIFYTTHYMDEAEYADHICIMKKGRVLAWGSKRGILKEYERMGCKNIRDIYMHVLRENYQL